MGIFVLPLYRDGMNTQEPSSALNPNPAAVVSLVEQLVAGMWPRSDADRKAWFDRLGLVSGASWDNAGTAPTVAHYSLRTPLAGGEVSTSWTTYNGRFLGINTQLYSSMETDNPSTLAGFVEIHHRLTELYGEASTPWQDPVVPACVWHVNGRRIVIRFFNLQHSGMMLSVEDAGLASAAEAEAKRQVVPTHWNDSEEGMSPFAIPTMRRQG